MSTQLAIDLDIDILCISMHISSALDSMIHGSREELLMRTSMEQSLATFSPAALAARVEAACL